LRQQQQFFLSTWTGQQQQHLLLLTESAVVSVLDAIAMSVDLMDALKGAIVGAVVVLNQHLHLE